MGWSQYGEGEKKITRLYRITANHKFRIYTIYVQKNTNETNIVEWTIKNNKNTADMCDSRWIDRIFIEAYKSSLRSRQENKAINIGFNVRWTLCRVRLDVLSCIIIYNVKYML